MLRLYISYAPADKPYLDKLLKWLKPLEERYALRLWYADPAKSAPFLYDPQQPAGSMLRYPLDWELSLNRLEQAHIYLFLVSYNSLSTPYIEQEEVPRAAERYSKKSKRLVRIFPVLLSPSLWKEQSRLSGFPVLGGPLSLSERKKKEEEEEAFLQVVTELRVAVEELRRNWLEEKHLLSAGTDGMDTPELLPATPAAFQPLPGWAGVALLLSVFYLVTAFYLRSCAPRMYHMYVPKELPYEAAPDRYLRENPLVDPVDVPLRPEE